MKPPLQENLFLARMVGRVPLQKPESTALIPGLLLTAIIGALSIFLSQQLGLRELNPLLLAVLFGMAFRHILLLPENCRAGVQFSMKRLLRLAVILLGLRLSIGEVMTIGPMGLILVLSTTTSTYYFANWLGHRLQINRTLTRLIAAGTSICGASAIVAANAAIDGSEEDVTYAISTITGFGTLAMLTYPLLSSLFQLSPQFFGIWCGLSIHEVAQVIATAFQGGIVSGDLATITKLTRVLLVIPMVVNLSYSSSLHRLPDEDRNTQVAIPWFVVFFCIFVLINSLNIIPENIKETVLIGNKFLLCMALAAMGLQTNLGQLRCLGLRPIYLAGSSWLFLSLISFAMIKLMTAF